MTEEELKKYFNSNIAPQLADKINNLPSAPVVGSVGGRNVQSGQKLTGEEMFNYTPGEKTDVSMISSNMGQDAVNQDKEYLDNITAVVENKPEKTANVEATATGDTGQTEEGYTLQEAMDIFGNDFTGIQERNGKFYPDTSAWERAGITGLQPSEEQQLQSGVNEVNTQIENLVNDFNSYNIDTDPAYTTYAENIRAQYDKMRREMEDYNQRREAALKTMGLRGGTTRYAGGVQAGIISEEVSQASERIGEITRLENQAITEARQAFESNSYTKFSQKIDALKTLRETKADALKAYNDKLVAANEALQTQQQFDLDVLKFQLDLEKESSTTDTKEYNLAKEQGFDGSFMDYLVAKEAISKVYTPDKPMIVSAGSSIYDPNTGEFLGTAPKPIDTKAPETAKWGGVVHQWDTLSQSWITLGTEEDLSNVDTQIVADWADQIRQGKAKISDITGEPELKSAVVTALNNMPPTKESVNEAQSMVNSLKEILNHPGLNSAVGPYGINRIPLKDIGGAKKEFIGLVNKFVSQQALDKLIESKKEGATFGALSDREMAILRSAATSLGSWEKTNDQGKVVGYQISQSAFKKEIQNIINGYQKVIDEASGIIGDSTNIQTLTQYYQNNPDKQARVEQLMNQNPDLSDDEILQIVTGNNSPSNEEFNW